MKKNVILLVIDALMPSRTGFGGNIPSLSPELNRIAASSLNCSKAFTMGNPTEFALPGLFASSYLLDDGGFADGIGNRKITFAEALKREGYRTAAFFPIYRPFYHGYDRGFDEFFQYYDPNVILKNFNNVANWYLRQFRSGGLSEAECAELLGKDCDVYFSDILQYCRTWQAYKKNPVVPASLVFANIDFEVLEREIEQERRRFESSRAEHITKFLHGGGFGFVEIINNFVEARARKAPLCWADIKFRLVLLWNLASVWFASTSYKSAKSAFALALYRVLQGQQHWIKYPSGGYMLEAFKKWIDHLDGPAPFYTYLHIVDAHEFCHYSYDVPGNDGEKALELKLFGEALRDIKRTPGYKGNILYDTSIRYADHVVTRLREYLESRNLLKDTMIVVTADHGGVYPNIPVRDSMAHRVDCFFDELYQIPMIFSGAGIAPYRHEGLVSSVDIAPTVLETLGIPIPESFKGTPVRAGEKTRDHVTMENQGRGPSDLARKSTRVCVRTETMKLVYQTEPLVAAGKKQFIVELFDLVADPLEIHNLAGNEAAVQRAVPLIRIARDRIHDIYR
jgi:hypothetical protein